MENLEIKKSYVCYSCCVCKKQYNENDVENLKYKFYCPNCQDKAVENEINLKKIKQAWFEEQKKPEQENNNDITECDNDKCNYLNSKKLFYNIGCYSYCIDCFFAIGRHVAINGF